MEFNVKKLVKDAGTAFNRVVQRTEERFGTSEKTELDSHLGHLSKRSDSTKLWTEKIMSNTLAVLIPNISDRVEEYLFDKIDKKKPNRLSNLEYLGNDMIEAGNDFGAGTPYGTALIKVGQSEQRLGQVERDFISSAHHCFVTPLRKFLDDEMKTIEKERNLLEIKRLDLDACKSKLRKARCMQNAQTKDGVNPEVLLQQAERDLRIARSEFDRQAEITKLLLEGVNNSAHASHLRCLHEFVESQVRYYSQCNQIMQDLQRELTRPSAAPILRLNSEDIEVSSPNDSSLTSSLVVPDYLSLVTPGAAPFQPLSLSPEKPKDESILKYPAQKARVLYDYDAKDSTELSLLADEVISVREVPDIETDYLMGERGSQMGKVPKAFLEIISH